MTKQTDIYYKANDGTRFETEEECREYETEKERYALALKKKREAEKEIAVIEYARFRREGRFAKPTTGSFGCGHDGYYTKCPHCGEYTGNYEGRNLKLKVDDKGIYKCEKCGCFFSYA